MFDRKGVLAIEKDDSIDEEEFMMEAIELGAEDFTSDENGYEIITSPEDFNGIRDALKEKGFNFVTAEISQIPQNTISLTEEKDIKNMVKLIDILEDNDDVQEVYHNWDIPDDLEIE